MVSRGVTSSPSNYNLFFSQQTARQLYVRRRDVSPRPTVDSPLQRLYYTFCVRKQGKGTGYLVSARARPTFPENSKQQSGRGSGSGSAGSAEIGGERRERRETTWESLPGLWGGRKGSDLIVLERSGLRDGIRALLDFLFSSSSSENGLKTCTPVVRSSSVVMAQNAELVSLLVDGCRYGDMEDVTEGENRRNRDPSHGRKGVCALQSDSGSDRSEN